MIESLRTVYIVEECLYVSMENTLQYVRYVVVVAYVCTIE